MVWGVGSIAGWLVGEVCSTGLAVVGGSAVSVVAIVGCAVIEGCSVVLGTGVVVCCCMGVVGIVC